MEVDPSGIHITIRVRANVPNFFDPYLSADATLRIAAIDGNLTLTLASFSCDVDFKWWHHAVTLGVTKWIEHNVEGS